MVVGAADSCVEIEEEIKDGSGVGGTVDDETAQTDVQ